MQKGERGDDVALIGRLRTQVVEAIDEAVPADAPVALVNFPNHANAGDDALWLATLDVLRTLGRHVAYAASWSSYEPGALRAAAPEGPILLNAGGNLGDVYPGQQGTRERVLQDFAGRPVVQLPQSLWFREQENLDRMRRLVDAHGAFSLMVRDDVSLQQARAAFDAPVQRVPDLVFSSGPLPRPEVAPELRARVLWQARRDPEMPGALDGSDLQEPPAGVVRADWLAPYDHEPPQPLSFRVARRAYATLGGTEPVTSAARARLLARTFEPLARHWLHRGTALLARGDVVVTDRLHGHVLCLLMGIPHVVTPNRNGKVRALWDTDTHDAHVAHWADAPADAIDLALDLAGSR